MKYNYFFTLEWDIDGYVAYIPAFQATIVDDDIDSILLAIDDAIDTCIQICKKEGRPIPPEDGNIQASGKIALRVPKSLHKKILIQAKHEGVSMNQFILSKLAGV